MNGDFWVCKDDFNKKKTEGKNVIFTERSLSVNACIVTIKEHNLLGERTIVGLRAVKEAVRCQDPQHLRSENVPITKDMKVAVRSAHAIYLK